MQPLSLDNFDLNADSQPRLDAALESAEALHGRLADLNDALTRLCERLLGEGDTAGEPLAAAGGSGKIGALHATLIEAGFRLDEIERRVGILQTIG